MPTNNQPLMDYIPNKHLLSLSGTPYFWNINGIRKDGDKAIVSGWALPAGGRIRSSNILIDGHKRGRVNFSENETVARLYPWWPNARMSQFSLEVSVAEFDLMAREEIVVESTSAETSDGGRRNKTAFYFRPADMQSAFPDEVISSRIGTNNPFQFSMSGLTLARQFTRVFEAATERKWTDNDMICDWGCGSGRVARHIVRDLAPHQEFIGFDIDGPAVEWATRHIAPMFRQTEMEPPLPFDAGGIDVVYAYSVFTHLTLPHIRKWVSEMARVIKKGGHFIFTILSDTALVALMPYADEALIAQFSSQGGYDIVKNAQLESINVSGDYYRNAWYTKNVIRNELQELFEVLLIEENFHFYQDVVVCRRR